MKEIRGTREYGFYTIDYEADCYRFPSVTSVLSHIKDPDLEELKELLGPEKFAEVSKNGADRGTIMHGFLENYCKAMKHFKDKDKALQYMQQKTPKQFEEFFPKTMIDTARDMAYSILNGGFEEELKMPFLIEGLMANFDLGYAGRTDIIFVNQKNELILGDYKSSSKKLDPCCNKVLKYKLQLSAYWVAFEKFYEKKIKEGVIFVAYPDANQGFQKITLSEFEKEIYYAYFEKIFRDCYEFIEGKYKVGMICPF